MANMMVSSQFVRLLDDKLKGVLYEQYNQLSPMIDKLYNRQDHDSAFAEYAEIGDMPDIPQFKGSLDYLSVNPGYYNKLEPREFAGGCIFEKKLLLNDRYNVMVNIGGQLSTSAMRVMDKFGARPFQNAFSAVFDFQTSEEGLSLCNSAHLTKSGVSTATGFSNAGSSALSKTAVYAAYIAMRKFRNDIGERIQINPDTLIVPDALLPTALEIIGTPKGLYTSEGTVNVWNQRFNVIPYLRLDDTSTTNWFMVDSTLMKRYLLWLDRVKPETETFYDFETKAVKHSVYFQIGNGSLNWRWAYGNQV